MRSPHPYCLLNGRWFHGGISGVCRMDPHPRCRIPWLLPDSPGVSTDKGIVKPERCILYDEPLGLFHQIGSAFPGHHFELDELTGCRKTLRRLAALLRPHPWTRAVILDWESPEALLLRTRNDALLLDLILLRDLLQQAETMELLREPTGETCLRFQRC